MSRIGKQPVPVPAGVKVRVDAGTVFVEGSKAKLQFTHHRDVSVAVADGGKSLVVTRKSEDRLGRSLHGLTRTIVANMVEGVTKGYEKKLKIEGIGYQARVDGKSVVVTVGFANPIAVVPQAGVKDGRLTDAKLAAMHPILVIVPDGVTVEVPDPTTIVVKGADKQKVGQCAAEIRSKRKPEPYKGKGIRYENEVVRRKEGKAFSSGG
jgi:large subunit ribosomal protein L6